jgi:hypothetical protein
MQFSKTHINKTACSQAIQYPGFEFQSYHSGKSNARVVDKFKLPILQR